jgi:hypothetical protein
MAFRRGEPRARFKRNGNGIKALALKEIPGYTNDSGLECFLTEMLNGLRRKVRIHWNSVTLTS